MVENSKERFRKMLCDAVPDKDVLLNKDRMAERGPLGETFKVPVESMMAIGELYRDMAERLTGSAVPTHRERATGNPRRASSVRDRSVRPGDIGGLPDG